MLMEYFLDRVMATDNDDPFDMPEGYTKYDYQMDAVIEGYQKLIRYDGFFLADVVGLGKTVHCYNDCQKVFDRKMDVNTPRFL